MLAETRQPESLEGLTFEEPEDGLLVIFLEFNQVSFGKAAEGDVILVDEPE